MTRRDPDPPDPDRVKMTGEKFLLAFVLPLVMDALLLGVWRDGALVIWGICATTGFVFLTKGCSDRTRGIVALAYFPLMAAVFFVAAMFFMPFAIRIHGE